MSSSGSSCSWGSDMWQPGKLDNSFSCSWLAVHKNRKTKLILSTQGRRWGRQRGRENGRESERREGNGMGVSSSVACRSVRRQFSLRIWTFGIAHMAFCAALRIRPIVHGAQLSCTRKRVLLLLLLVCGSVTICVCVGLLCLGTARALMHASKHNQYLQIELQTAAALAAVAATAVAVPAGRGCGTVVPLAS